LGGRGEGRKGLQEGRGLSVAIVALKRDKNSRKNNDMGIERTKIATPPGRDTPSGEASVEDVGNKKR